MKTSFISKKLCCLSVATLSVLISPALQPVVSAQPRIGLPIVPPQGMEQKQSTYGLLETLPTSKITAPGVLEVSFRTSTPTPPATVYYGINTFDEELNYPRMRSAVREQGEGLIQDHKIEIEFGSLLSKIPNTPFEPRITWQAEVWVPSKNSSRMFQGRAYFNPETLDTTENISFGPTVEQLAPNSVIIAFDTDELAVGLAQVFSENGALVSENTSMPRKKHEIRISDLNPGQTYHYSVRAGNTVTRRYSFTTPNPAQPFQFAAMVDSREGVGGGLENFSGVNAFSLYALGSDAYYRGADFILFPGDLINGYTTSTVDFEFQLNSFRRILEPVHSRIPIYEGMGNHEALLDVYDDGSRYGLGIDKQGDESAEALFAAAFVNPLNGPANEGGESPTYKENVYYFDHGNSRFFVLNNNYWYSRDPHVLGGNLEGYFLPAQISWLREQITRAEAEPAITHLFFAAQEPCFPNGGHTADSMWYNGGDTNRDGTIDENDIKIVENRNEFWEVISSSAKSVAFITGDEHAYSRVLIDSTTNVGHKRKADGTEAEFKYPVMQVTSGGAGAPWYDVELHLPWSDSLLQHSTQPHYAFFSVDGERVDLEVYAQTGQLIDSATLKNDTRPLIQKRP